jgi:hypothetical protein
MNPVQSTKYSKIIVFALILLIQAVPAFSQAGMSFKEFEKKLEGYYDADMIGDISKQVPQTGDFSIWGWDVGDFSGDGFSDLAFSVKIMSEKSKTSKVFMFVDIDGFLTKTGEFEYQYFELPLEIGVSIKDNACYVTKKLRQFEWLIYGYRFDNGSLVLLSQYSTTRQNDLTLEFLTNYQTLQNTEKYMLTNTGVIKRRLSYFAILFKGSSDLQRFFKLGLQWKNRLCQSWSLLLDRTGGCLVQG